MLPPPDTGVWSQFDVHTAQYSRKAYYISGAGVGIQIPQGCIEKSGDEAEIKWPKFCTV